MKKVILALVLAVIVVPSALATTVDFSMSGVSWSWGGGVGSQLTASSPIVIATGSGGGGPFLVGPAFVTTGGALAGPNSGPFTFGSGGTISVFDGAVCGGVCFTGSFASVQLAHNVSGGLSFSADIVFGNVSAVLLASLGLPVVPTTYEGFMTGTLASPGATTLLGGGGSCNAAGACENTGSMDLNLHPVPEPGTLAMFGSGLIGIAGLLRRKLNL